MNCIRCDSDYTRMAGVQRFKIDYGYCSLSCLIADKPPCPGCGAALTPNTDERLAAFVQRSFCTQHCAASFNSSMPKSAETRRRMGDAARSRPPEHWAKVQEGIKRTFDADPERAARARNRMREGQQQWRKTPEGIKATTDDYARRMRERGHYQANSERMAAFYQTPDGDAFKARMSQARKGVARPPHVTQRVRESVIRYWNTPEGIALRERLSELRSDGLHDAPYGPNWNNQRSKARKRDGCCILCERTDEQNGKALDVHHIHARRKFGYVPGQNTNYQFANHLANLITLCPACHMRVEMKGATVPVDYQQQADALWTLFTAT